MSRLHATRCRVPQLILTVGREGPEKTQQNTLLLKFRNVSAAMCDLRGYPVIALIGNKGTQLDFNSRRRGGEMLTRMRPALVPLRPGASAYSAINKNSCAAPGRISVRIKVTPPQAGGALSVTLHRYPILEYCGSSDLGHNIDISPVESSAAAVLSRQ